MLAELVVQFICQLEAHYRQHDSESRCGTGDLEVQAGPGSHGAAALTLPVAARATASEAATGSQGDLDSTTVTTASGTAYASGPPGLA